MSSVVSFTSNSSEQRCNVLCCLCGVSIPPNPMNMCPNCLRSKVDITMGISRNLAVCFCRDCGRYQVPPSSWATCELGSPELMALCLKRIPGLNKLSLINARWIWTEEHSRRLQIELTVRKEVFEGCILEDTFEVVFVVGTQQCEDCKRSYTEHTWTACVQVRQYHVQHKRAMFYLEQLVLKRQAAGLFHATGVTEVGDGLDFFFSNRSQAQNFCTFVGGTLASTSVKSDKLIGADLANNIYNKKYVFMVDVLPLWKGDLVILPKKLATARHISRVLVVLRLGDTVRCVDPFTAERINIGLKEYNQSSFKPALGPRSLQRFTVLDIENEGRGSNTGRSQRASAQVVLTADLEAGVADMQTYEIYTHLGGLLEVGDEVEGYYLPLHESALEVNHDVRAQDLPKVVLVRKYYPARAHGKKRRFFLRKFRDLDAEAAGAMQYHNLVDVSVNQRRIEEEFEEFMNDLEDVPEMRREIQMYAAEGAQDIPDMPEAGPQVAMEELLRELSAF